MIYGIIYDAVKRKAETTPPNNYIGNVEMAAGIGIVLHGMKKKLDNIEAMEEPQELKEQFLKIVEEVGVEQLDDLSKIIVEKVKKYQVKEMVNETMEDLVILIRDYEKIMAGKEVSGQL